MSDAIYHIKPYALMGGGILTIVAGPNNVAIAGGVVILLLGSLIFKWRWGNK